MNTNQVAVGTFGGDGGYDQWSFVLPDFCKFTSIRIDSTPNFVYYIRFTYLNVKDNQQHNSAHGGDNPAGKTDILNIPYGQKITVVSGTSASYNGSTYITSLSFIVGSKSYGPYGQQRGNAFRIPVSRGKITGFYGNFGEGLANLGVYLSPDN